MHNDSVNMNKTQLEEFFSGLQSGLESYRNVRAKYNKRMAFDFNSVDFFWPGENKVSEILGFFIDPQQTHGQGDAFLRQFLLRDELEDARNIYDKEKKATLHLEHRTDEWRRVDIVIEIGNKGYFIGIENKVGTAADQFQQLAHYSGHLSNKAKRGYFLYYLTPSGNDPSEYSITEDELNKLRDSKNFATLSYENDIIDIFESFEHCCQADNVRAFIRDFNQHLKKRFTGEKFMSEANYIAQYIQDSPQRQNTAIDILYSQWSIWDQLYQGLRGDIFEEYSNDYEISMPETVGQFMNTSGTDLLVLSKSNWQSTSIRLRFNQKYARGLHVGIAKEQHNESLKAVREKFPEDSHNDFWVCFSFIKEYSDWYEFPEPWRKMIKASDEPCPLAEEMIEIVNKYAEALEALEKS